MEAGSHEQRERALDLANQVRYKRAQLKRDLKAGRRSIAEVVLDPPEWIRGARVFDLVMAAPGLGSVKVNKILGVVPISPAKTIGSLTERQRDVLAAALRGTPIPVYAQRVQTWEEIAA